MKPKVDMQIEFNPYGTDERWHGVITAVHNESTVNAIVMNGDDVTIEKPDIHFCGPEEPCEVSMCKALGKVKKKEKGKPNVAEVQASIEQEVGDDGE